MSDDEIRKRVRAGLADGTLRQPQAMAPAKFGQPTEYLTPGRPQTDPRAVCAACGKESTQITYDFSDGPIAFHDRCHIIWQEEAG